MVVSQILRIFADMRTKREKEEARINKEALGVLAGFIIDLAKLVFGGIILSGLLDLSFSKSSMIVSGSVVVVLLLLLWYSLFKRSKRKEGL